MDWRRSVAQAGDVWNEERHAHFPRPVRAIIVTLLVVARTSNLRTRERSCRLAGANVLALYALFRWIARLNYFEASDESAGELASHDQASACCCII